MNKEREKIIEKIISGVPNRFRDSYFKKNHTEIFIEVEKFCEKISDLLWVQKIWHWINELDTYYLCDCGNRTSFDSFMKGYKFGCCAKCTQKNPITKEKRKQTTIDKYGVDNIAKLDEIKNRTEATNMERYGTKSSFQNEDVKKKWKDTIQKKYGVDHYFQTDEFKIQSKKHYYDKYGVDFVWEVKSIKQKIKDTCMDRYGVETYLNTEHSRSMIKSYNRSSFELEICEWLESLKINFYHSYRNLIAPLILDVYIPEFNLALEYNGLWWHGEYNKEKEYHINKTNECNKVGVQLIHIWEDNWKFKKDIVKSIILNKLSISEKKIYARKCIIKELNNDETSLFLNNNHIQGYTTFNKSYGLFYNEELVSLMSFGFRNVNSKREYELIRFCNKINYNILGSASKLFSYFLKINPEIIEISSYADISMFTGNLYIKLGFDFSHRSDINYWWVVKNIRKHRFNFNKKKLVKMGHEIWKTEVEIMHELGHYKIYGCGQEKYIWLKT